MSFILSSANIQPLAQNPLVLSHAVMLEVFPWDAD